MTSWLLVWGGAFEAGSGSQGTPQPAAEATPAATEGTPPAGAPATPGPPAPAPAPGAAPGAPAPPPVPQHGTGEVRLAAFARPAPAGQKGRSIRIRVEVEQGLALDPEAVAREAADVLQDPRSWTSRGEAHFDFVGTGPAELTLRVLTPDTTDQRCLPLKTLGEVSCQQGQGVNLNARRWVEAVPDYRGDVAGYRKYLVNHEVGHFLGHQHSECPGPGQVAPVMMQQTKGLDGCRANSWPQPGRTP
ncbi:DUF3152 domain-containing protein [Naumannella sp. ID2617S]|nr:DUF3152 domain-containing protein [Naumannella sp. ID2617S]